MRHQSIWLTGLLLAFVIFFSFSLPASDKKGKIKPASKAVASRADSSESVSDLYNAMGLAARGLDRDIFNRAWQGFIKLNAQQLVKNPVLSIVDLSQPSCQKRLYIIDMINKQLLVNTLVAHGRNSGYTVASKFSNKPESLQSSLGFYITGSTYLGSNGYSLRLTGLEKGFNDQAENRAIVMHGAAYVNENIAKKTGRVGRSWGCPAVPEKEHKQIINLVKNGSCLFIYAPQKQYLAQSVFSTANSNQL